MKRAHSLTLPLATLVGLLAASTFPISKNIFAEDSLPELPSVLTLSDIARQYARRDTEHLTEDQYKSLLGLPNDWNELNPDEIEQHQSLLQVTYFYKRTPQGIEIDYELPYLKRLEQGGMIEGVAFIGETPFRSYSPEISFQVNNPKPYPLLLSEAEIHVESSQPDRSAIPIIRDERNWLGGIALYNFGWALAKNVKIQFAFAPLAEYGSSALWDRPPQYGVGPFDLRDFVFLDGLAEILPATLKEHFEVVVFGSIEYFDQGKQVERRVTFKTVVSFHSRPERYVPSSTTYQLPLQAGKAGYTEYIPLSQTIDPHSSDHFKIRVHSDRSASYSLRINLRASNEESIFQGTVKLRYFRPKRDKVRISSPAFHEHITSRFAAAAGLQDSIVAITRDKAAPATIFIFVREDRELPEESMDKLAIMLRTHFMQENSDEDEIVLRQIDHTGVETGWPYILRLQ